MPIKHIEQLDAIGFVWEAGGWQWQRVLKSLHVYKELHGDLEAHSDFMVPQRRCGFEDVGHQLGKRVLTIRNQEIYVKDRLDRVAGELNRMDYKGT